MSAPRQDIRDLAKHDHTCENCGTAFKQTVRFCKPQFPQTSSGCKGFIDFLPRALGRLTRYCMCKSCAKEAVTWEDLGLLGQSVLGQANTAAYLAPSCLACSQSGAEAATAFASSAGQMPPWEMAA